MYVLQLGGGGGYLTNKELCAVCMWGGGVSMPLMAPSFGSAYAF